MDDIAGKERHLPLTMLISFGFWSFFLRSITFLLLEQIRGSDVRDLQLINLSWMRANDQPTMSQVVKERPGKSSDIVTTRVFDVFWELVFKAQTDPELFPQFWGPERYTTTVEKMEIRKGEVWRTCSVTLKAMSPPSTCVSRGYPKTDHRHLGMGRHARTSAS